MVEESIIEQALTSPAIEVSINYPSLHLESGIIKKAMGYTDHQPPARVSRSINNLLMEARDYVDIRGSYRLVIPREITVERDKTRLDGHIWHTGKIITVQLKGISGLAVFAVTIGPRFDVWSREFFRHDEELDGYVADTIGSEIVEAAVDHIEEIINQEAQKQNLGCTNRFSPGYCEWHVSEQHKLFTLLPECVCGITLTDSALMVPMKSVSGIIGLGPGMVKKDYQCSICDIEHCYKRLV